MADIDKTTEALFHFGIPLVGPVTVETYRQEMLEQWHEKDMESAIMDGLSRDMLFVGDEDLKGKQ